MKIIHTADVHLGSKIESKLPKDKSDIRKAEVRQAFNNMVEYAIQNDISIIMISGDLFDSTRPLKKDKEFFYNVVRNNPDIEFIYLRGNHDCFEDETGGSLANLKMFTDKWRTYTYGGDGEEIITISGIEVLSDSENDNNQYELLYGLQLDAKNKNIVMLHGMAEKFAEIKEKNIDYMALGHIHKFAEVPVNMRVSANIRGKAIYSGCLEGRGFDEVGVKGFVVIDTDKMSVDFVENSIRVIEEFSVDISETKDSYEAYKKVKETVNANSKNICIINLCGQITFDGLYIKEDVAEYLKEDYFFVYVKNNTTEKIDFLKLAEEKTLKGEFVRTVLANKNYSEKQKERIVSVGLKAFDGQEAIK